MKTVYTDVQMRLLAGLFTVVALVGCTDPSPPVLPPLPALPPIPQALLVYCCGHCGVCYHVPVPVGPIPAHNKCPNCGYPARLKMNLDPPQADTPATPDRRRTVEFREVPQGGEFWVGGNLYKKQSRTVGVRDDIIDVTPKRFDPRTKVEIEDDGVAK